MILTLCGRQNDEYSFTVFNNTSAQSYIQSGIDLSTVTTATLYFKRVNDVPANEVSLSLGTDFQFLFDDGGLTVNFADFGEDLINGYDFFPDEMYNIRITYIYDGNQYEASITVGFLKIIKNIVYQQMIKSNWRKELACSCGCDPYNTTLRKWEYLYNLDISAALCLIADFQLTLKSLYKLTGTEYEFE